MDLKTALKTAIDFEEKGHSIYTKAAETTDNPIVEKTFSYLADEELNHIDELKGYMKTKQIELKGDKLEQTKQFFSMTIREFKEKTELSEDDLKAHETGLELEKKSYDFYKQQYEAADDQKLKEFFKWIMAQENAHYELIDKAYQFIKDPEGFYSKEEKWIADGG